MTREELKAQAQIIWSFINSEERMREHVFQQDANKRDRKVAECRKAKEALRAIKTFADLHTEESPEQVQLFDEELSPPVRKGGY